MDINNWGWPQFVYAALLVLGIGLEMGRNGKPKTGNHDLVSSILATAFIVSILYYGGFFK